MTQDQYGQARDSGYASGHVVEDDDTGEYADDQGKPMTRFQKVASALRGDRSDPDPQTAQDPDMFQPGAPASDGSVGVGANDPRTNGRGTDDLGNGTPAPYADDQRADYQDEAGDATLPDVPVTHAPAAAVVTEPTAGPVVTEAPGDAAVTDVPGGPGRHAAAPAQDLRPGEGARTLDNLGDLAYGKLLPDAADFTAQWQQIQFKFVDDPRASVTEAAEVVAQVTAKMEAAIAERQRAIQERQRAIAEQQSSLQGRWGEGSEADTETLRETLRMYKAFLDQLVGPKA